MTWAPVFISIYLFISSFIHYSVPMVPLPKVVVQDGFQHTSRWSYNKHIKNSLLIAGQIIAVQFSVPSAWIVYRYLVYG